jgi:signal transduction histidine kinase
MHHINDRLARILVWIAGVVATVITFAAPTGYFLLELQNHRGSLESEADLNARLLSPAMTIGPEGVRFEKTRLEEFLARRPRPGYAEARRILDLENRVIAERADPLVESPMLTRSADLRYSGVKIGRIEIARSLRLALIRTASIALLGALLGWLTFLVFKVIPMRALRRVVAENARLLESARRNAREQGALNAIAAATARSLHLDAVLGIALDKALEVTGRDRGYICLKDPSSGRISVAAHRGIGAEHLDSLSRFVIRGGSGDAVLESDKAIVSNDTRKQYPGGEAPRDGSRALVQVPLKSKGLAIGFLTVATSTSIPFQPREVQFVEAIGNIIGVAIDNARLFSATEQNLRRMQTLLEIDQAIASTLDRGTLLSLLLEKISRGLPSSAISVELFDPETGRVQRVACCNLDEAEWNSPNERQGLRIANFVLRQKAPLKIGNLQTDRNWGDAEYFRKLGLVSYMGIPLIGKGEMLGVLSTYTKYEHEFNDEEIKLLSMVASQAAMAIQNAQLYEQTKTQATELDKANKLQADFTAMIAHDLRSPLTGIMGAAEMMDAGLLGSVNEEQKKWLGKIQATGRKLVDLVSDFLDLAKIEAGHIGLAKEDMDLEQLISSTLENYLPLAQEKGITLRHSTPTLPTLHADPRRLDQVLCNLLGNAIKFTNQGGAVEIGACLGGGAEVKVYVKDTGVGIPKDEIAGLFQKYQQATSGKAYGKKGTGLGLVISKMIVEAHGGTIWVESEEGQGTAFFFTLPFATENVTPDASTQLQVSAPIRA